MGFDFRNGTDTERQKDLEELAFESENKVHGVHYQASKVAPLSRLLRAFDIPKQGAFVDFGCGKGRVLLVAAQCGFRRVIGVEFSNELCEIARQNLAVFERRRDSPLDVEIVEIDAAKFVIQQDQTVFYFFNPFNEVVFRRVMENLRDSLVSSPRKIWLIYNTPLHRDLVASTGIFTSTFDFESRGNRFSVFRN